MAKSDYVLEDKIFSKTEWTKEEQKAHRDAWIKALRSGEFKQTRETLKSRNGAMCCLGVACEIAGLEAKYVDNEYQYDGDNSGTLSIAARDYYGLKSQDGGFDLILIDDIVAHSTSLVSLNDKHGYDFKKIAEVIESEPEGLVK